MFFALLVPLAVWLLIALGVGWPGEVFHLVQQASFLLVPLVYARAVGLRPLETSGYVRLPLRKAALVLVASFGSMWLLQGLNELQDPILTWLGMGKKAAQERVQLARGLEVAQQQGMLLAGFIFGVVAPLCEETLFRGLVFRGFARRLGSMPTLAITSVFFAAMHGTRVQFALMLALGLYFGALVWLTGSLWAGILAHAANNIVVLILTAKYGVRMETLRGPWWIYPLSAVVFAGAMTLLALDRRGKVATSS